jgi:hypothetical protein
MKIWKILRSLKSLEDGMARFYDALRLHHNSNAEVAAFYLKKERNLALPIIFWSSDAGGPFGEYLTECGADLVLDQRDQESLRSLQQYLGKLRR